MTNEMRITKSGTAADQSRIVPYSSFLFRHSSSVIRHFRHLLPCLVLAFNSLSLEISAQNWALVWSDEFTQPNLSSPDPAKWGFETGGTGWGNNELEYYTSRTNNA